jgi:hypothetical protein
LGNTQQIHQVLNFHDHFCIIFTLC